MRLKLKSDTLLSASAFKFNLRRYNVERPRALQTAQQQQRDSGALIGQWSAVAGGAAQIRDSTGNPIASLLLPINVI